MSYTSQCTNFWGVSMSWTRRARLAVPEGTSLHDNGGDWLAPSQVYGTGMLPPSLKALLVRAMRAPVSSAAVVVVDTFLAEPPPPPPHAAAVTRNATASLRSTRLFYPERGHVPDGVEPSTVPDDTEAREAEGLIVDAAGLD